MEFEELQRLVAREPVFDSSFLLVGDVNPDYLRRQLSEWVSSGKLLQLRRGLYALAPPYQKIAPHPFLVANRLRSGSYVSLQAALAYYGLIPEHVEAITSVTTARPTQWETPVGRFTYRHIQSDLFFGYRRRALSGEPVQFAFVASPEKALLDLIYLQPGGDSPAYVHSLRLQNLDVLDTNTLHKLAERTRKPKLERAAKLIATLIAEDAAEFENL